MEQITFKRGDFQAFTATRTFALGDKTNILKDTELDFDGSTVQYQGDTYPYPQLRAAIKVGWIVLTDDYSAGNPEYGRPMAADIRVHSAVRTQGDKDRTSNLTAPVATEADERIVMSHADHAQRTKAVNAGESASDYQNQEGIPVGRRFKTAAVSTTSLEKASSVIRDLDRIQIDPAQGQTEDEMLARMTDSMREEYLQKKSDTRRRYTDDAPNPVVVNRVANQKTQEKDGFKVTSSVGGGVETFDSFGTGGDVVESTVVEDGIVMKNTNGPKRQVAFPHPRSEESPAPVPAGGASDVRVMVARTMCPDFPQTYDFNATPRKKVARLMADFEDRLDVIRAAYAADSDDVKTQIMSEFPEAFQG